MAYYLEKESTAKLFEELLKNYRILGPKIQKGIGRFSDTDVIGYGEIKKLEDLIFDQKSEFSPKEAVIPMRETLFKWEGEVFETPELEEKEIIVFVRPCDIHGFNRLDQIYLKNGNIQDPYYKRRRDQLHFFMLECKDGFENCFCVSMNTHVSHDYEVAVRKSGNRFDFDVKAAVFELYFQGADPSAFKPEFVTENTVKVQIPELGKIKTTHFDNPLWIEYTERCIHCGRCNTSCGTCSCFTMQDVADPSTQKGERRRRWAGCQVNGFTDMAGGHSFRKKDGERMRFKTLHKVNDFAKRFGGEHMCVGCGRCDDVCPEYISFSKCINQLNDIIEEEAAYE